MQDIIIESSNQSSNIASNVRSVRIKQSRGMFRYVFDWIIKGLFVALLLGIDFLLFAGSGSQTIFSESLGLQPEIFTSLMVILVLSLLAMFLVSFSSLLQNLLASAVVGGVVLALLNQFAVYDKTSILEPMFAPYIGMSASFIFNGISHWILAGGAGILTFVILMMSSKSTTAYFTGILLIIFSGVLVDAYLIKNKTDDFVVRYDNHLDKASKNPRKYVYFFLPNASSYITLGEMKDKLGKDDKANELKGRLVAFLAKNGFWVYPNAYVSSTDTLNNTVELLNGLDDKKADEHILKNVEIDSLWNFSDVRDEYVFLKNAKLIDVYKNSNYRVTAIQSRGLDLCSKNNARNVDKCLDKVNTPVAVKNLKVSSWEQAKFLMVQWINSWHLITDWSVPYGAIDGFVRASELPIMGVSYDSLYVVNSFKALDALLEEIKKDKGSRAYFVFLDLPSDMYVYNEFCKLKPQSQWQTLTNYKWVGNKNLFEKRKAYQEQYSCLIGKLEQFMRSLKEKKLDKNTVVFLQGVSGINELGGPKTEDYIENFKRNNLVLLAVKNPMKNSFSINNQICESRELVKNYLYLKGECEELKGMGLYETAAKGLQADLLSNVLSQETLNGYLKNYDEWYQKWEGFNSKKSPKDKLKELKAKVKNEAPNPKIKDKKSEGEKINKAEEPLAEANKVEVSENSETETKEKVTDLPEEREVGKALVMEQPINEGKEQEVKSIKEEIQSDTEETSKENLDNKGIPLEKDVKSEYNSENSAVASDAADEVKNVETVAKEETKTSQTVEEANNTQAVDKAEKAPKVVGEAKAKTEATSNKTNNTLN